MRTFSSSCLAANDGLISVGGSVQDKIYFNIMTFAFKFKCKLAIDYWFDTFSSMTDSGFCDEQLMT